MAWWDFAFAKFTSPPPLTEHAIKELGFLNGAIVIIVEDKSRL